MGSARLGVLALAAALVLTAQAPAPDAALTGDQILARAKAAFRAHPRPPFIVYTLFRRDRHNGIPDFENSYALKVWCRTADRSALLRRLSNGVARGELQHVTVMFDRALDPGPPTADMFEKRLFGASSARRDGAGPTPSPDAATTAGEAGPPLPEIGRVNARDGDYAARRVAREGDLIHLWLEAKSDPDRNRLDELWLDARSYDLRRARVRDHLYLQFGPVLDETFDVQFVPGPGGLPLILSIHGQTREGDYETTYTFRDLTFPVALPDWYFEPRTYRAHVAEAPS